MKKYINPDFTRGYPSAKNVFYECIICDDIIMSAPDKTVSCKCKNVIIDADFGRMILKDESKVKVFEEV